MRRRRGPDLTDEDLTRLSALGGRADQIAEAAGIEVGQVRERLGAVGHEASSAVPVGRPVCVLPADGS